MLVLALIALLLLGISLAFVAYMVFHQVRGEFFDAEGTPIHYTVEGTGTPVVLIHGFAANSTLNWRVMGVHGELKKHYRVITMDVRGHGLSGKPHDPAQYGIRMVEDVRRLLDHLKIPKAHIVGYSMGGMITLKFLAVYPDRCISAAPLGVRRMEAKDSNIIRDIVARYRRDHTWKDAWNELSHGGVPPQIESFAIGRLTDLDALEAVGESITEIFVGATELKENKVPALLLIGSRDWMVGGAGDMQQTVGNLRCAIIEGGTHTSTLRKPEFLAQLTAFLGENDLPR